MGKSAFDDAPVRSWCRSVLLVICSLATLGAPVVASGQPSTYQIILLHPPGFTNSGAFGISLTQQVTGVGWNQGNMSDQQALLWSGAGTQVTSLNPGVGVASWGWAVSGSRIVGNVWTPGTPDSHRATAWLGNGSSRVTLTPPGFAVTTAYDVSGTLIVGNGGGPATSTAQHALLWTTPDPAAAVDLNPGHLGYLFSRAWGVDAASGQQVGDGNYLIGFDCDSACDANDRALLWTGTAASAVELHPAGFISSVASGTDGASQVGWGMPAGTTETHALLWRSSAASAVDLHPPGFTETFALMVRNGRQVGHGLGPMTQGLRHALLWRGSPASLEDLHVFLPEGYVESAALNVDQHGNVVGHATTAQGHYHAVLWQRLPGLLPLSFPDGTRVTGNRFARIRVRLDGPAPAGDAYVSLASSNPAVVAVPSSGRTIVPSGLDTVVDGLWVTPVAAQRTVTITASYNGSSRSATVTVVPPSLQALKFTPEQVPACQSTTALVLLDSAAPAGGATVAISGGPLLATWPSRVTIPAGADRTTFSVSAGKTTGTVTLSATYGSTRVGNRFSIVPATLPCPK
jgi:hypothetical protein